MWLHSESGESFCWEPLIIFIDEILSLCLCKYTRAAQKVLRRVADDHLSITAFATFHFYEKKTIVFSPLKIDIGHADHPWLPLRPGEDPQQDMSFKALKELQASSSQQNPRAVIIEF